MVVLYDRVAWTDDVVGLACVGVWEDERVGRIIESFVDVIASLIKGGAR